MRVTVLTVKKLTAGEQHIFVLACLLKEQVEAVIAVGLLYLNRITTTLSSCS